MCGAMTTLRLVILPKLGLLGFCLLALFSQASASEPVSPGALEVKESELARVAREFTVEFPWAKAVPVKAASAAGVESNMTSGDLILKTKGDLLREVRTVGGEQKEVITMNKDTVLEQISNKSVLRGQKIRITQDMQTGEAELIEANEEVELWTPGRCAKGELLVYECKPGVADRYIIEGGSKSHGRAHVWPGGDEVEADKFIIDERLGFFRALGSPDARITLPEKPDANPSPPGAMGGMKTIGSGKVRLKCDGELNYESATYKIIATRKVSIFQQSANTTINCDDAVFNLSPPSAVPPQGGDTLFSGDLKSMACNGRVKLKTPDSTIFFDKGLLDMTTHIFLMEMKNPKDNVRIYKKDENGSDTCTLSPKFFATNLETGVYWGAGPMKQDNVPAPPGEQKK
jgi:hypothetical protein